MKIEMKKHRALIGDWFKHVPFVFFVTRKSTISNPLLLIAKFKKLRGPAQSTLKLSEKLSGTYNEKQN